MEPRTYSGSMHAISVLWDLMNRSSHQDESSNSMKKVMKTYMRMRRPELWLMSDSSLCTTLLLLLPFIESRPHGDSAAWVKTCVCH